MIQSIAPSKQLAVRTGELMLCAENDKNINVLCGQITEFLKVKPYGTQ